MTDRETGEAIARMMRGEEPEPAPEHEQASEPQTPEPDDTPNQAERALLEAHTERKRRQAEAMGLVERQDDDLGGDAA